MAPIAVSITPTPGQPGDLEKEDHARDAAYAKAMHGESGKAGGGFAAMWGKDNSAQRQSSQNYFKFFEGGAGETEEEREVRFDSLLL